MAEVSTQNHSLFEKVQIYENDITQFERIQDSNRKERENIQEERNQMSDRAIQLETEIMQHIQGTLFICRSFNTKFIYESINRLLPTIIILE